MLIILETWKKLADQFDDDFNIKNNNDYKFKRYYIY